MFGVDDAIAAAGIVAGGQLLGTYMTNNQSSANAAAANETAINLASTSYQRRVDDLSKAGLNPMLAYSQGGAAVPNIQTPTLQNYGDAASSAVQAYNSGVNQDLVRSQIKTQETQQQLNNALAIKAAADAEVSTASAGEVTARTGTYAYQIGEAMARIDKIAQDTKLSFEQTILVKRQAANALATGQNIVADTGNKLADNQLKALAYELNKTNVPAAHNYMNASESWWGRNVAPFLPSFATGSTAAKNFSSVVK